MFMKPFREEHPAVDVDRLAGDVAAFGTHQKTHHRGDFLEGALAPERVVPVLLTLWDIRSAPWRRLWPILDDFGSRVVETGYKAQANCIQFGVRRVANLVGSDCFVLGYDVLISMQSVRNEYSAPLRKAGNIDLIWRLRPKSARTGCQFVMRMRHGISN